MLASVGTSATAVSSCVSSFGPRWRRRRPSLRFSDGLCRALSLGASDSVAWTTISSLSSSVSSEEFTSSSFATTSESSDCGRRCPPRRPRRRRLRLGRSSVSLSDSLASSCSASAAACSVSSVSSNGVSESGRRLRVRFLPPRLRRCRLALSFRSVASSESLSEGSTSASTTVSSAATGAKSAPHMRVRIPAFCGAAARGCSVITGASLTGVAVSDSVTTGAGP